MARGDFRFGVDLSEIRMRRTSSGMIDMMQHLAELMKLLKYQMLYYECLHQPAT